MKFKKHISLFLAIFLLISNIGLAFDVHFCGNNLVSVNPELFRADIKSNQKGCCEKKTIKKESCCKNKTVHLQKKSKESIFKIFSFSAKEYILPVQWHPIKVEITSVSSDKLEETYYYEEHSPPIYQLFHQYIFYE